MPAVAGRGALQRGSEDCVPVRRNGFGKVDCGRHWTGALAYLNGGWIRRTVRVERCEICRNDYW